MKKALTIALSASLFALSNGAQATAKPSEAEIRKAWNTCSIAGKVIPHAEGYDAGKTMATFVNAAVTDGLMNVSGASVLQNHLTTRANFAHIAQLKMQELDPDSAVSYCMGAQWVPLKEQAWSSVHSGLTDYLLPRAKKRFFEVPQR